VAVKATRNVVNVCYPTINNADCLGTRSIIERNLKLKPLT